MNGSSLEEAEARRLENLRAVLAGDEAGRRRGAAPASSAATPSPAATPHASHRKRNSLLGGIGTTLAFLLGKLKVLGLLASVLKFKTLGTMLLSVVLYATEWGWAFAAGFVVLIFVHEMGHAVVLRREGIPAGAPVFIPFLGAFIAMRGRPRDAYVEAKVAIGGPLIGSLAAWIVLALGLIRESQLLVTLGHTGILLNLFNLIPVSPLDGGRIAGAFTRGFWIAGYGLGVVALLLTRSPILLIVLVVGLLTLWQRLRHPVPGYDTIPRSKRLLVGLAYAALIIALSATLPIGMQIHPEIQQAS